jgi:hypothetical protein
MFFKLVCACGEQQILQLRACPTRKNSGPENPGRRSAQDGSIIKRERLSRNGKRARVSFRILKLVIYTRLFPWRGLGHWMTDATCPA